MSHSPLPWNVHPSGEIVDGIGVLIGLIYVAALKGEVETPNDDGNRSLIVTAVNNHAKLVETLERCLKLIEDESYNTRHDILSREAREVLAAARCQQPEKIVFQLNTPVPEPSPGATGAALAALRSVADLIDNTYDHDVETGRRVDAAGEISGADVFELLCGLEGEVVDAITLLEGGTIEDCNTPKNPAKVLIEVNGGCVEYSSAGNVDVHVIDYDADPDDEIPEEFQGLS